MVKTFSFPKGLRVMPKWGKWWWLNSPSHPALFGQPVGRVKEVLGEMDDPGMEIEIAVRKYSVPHQFSSACLALAAELA
jgi:ribonuclease R